jgi:hypothetical protein
VLLLIIHALAALASRFVIGTFFPIQAISLNSKSKSVPIPSTLLMNSVILLVCYICCATSMFVLFCLCEPILHLIGSTSHCVHPCNLPFHLLMFCDCACFLVLYLFVCVYLCWLVFMMWSMADAFSVCSLLPLMVCSIADAFGVCSLLPLKVCSIAKAFGVCSQLPLKVCSIADALGICSLLPLMVCSIADAFGVDILLPLMVNCIADACGVCFLLPSLLCICYLDRIWLCHDNLTIFTTILLQMLFSIHLQNAKDINYLGTTVLGGHRTRVMKYNDISAFMNDKTFTKCLDIESKDFHYIDYVAKDAMAQYSAECYLEVMLPMKKLIHFIPVVKGRQLAKLHGIPAGFHATVSQLKSLFDDHVACDICSTHVTIISVQPSSNQCKQMHKKECLAKKTDNEKQLICEQIQQRVAKHRSDKKDLDFDICDLASVFPPPPVDKTLSHKVIESACSKLKAESFEENGCAVCGQLVPISLLSRLSAVKNYLHILDAPGFTRQERHKASDKICEYPLAMDNSCRLICNPCRAALRLGNVPKMALARGLWLGRYLRFFLTCAMWKKCW